MAAGVHQVTMKTLQDLVSYGMHNADFRKGVLLVTLKTMPLTLLVRSLSAAFKRQWHFEIHTSWLCQKCQKYIIVYVPKF